MDRLATHDAQCVDRLTTHDTPCTDRLTTNDETQESKGAQQQENVKEDVTVTDANIVPKKSL